MWTISVLQEYILTFTTCTAVRTRAIAECFARFVNRLILSRVQSRGSSGTSRSIRIRCGLTASIWPFLSMLNIQQDMLRRSRRIPSLQTSFISLLQVQRIHMTLQPDFSVMLGTSRSQCSGVILRQVCQRTRGDAQQVGMQSL